MTSRIVTGKRQFISVPRSREKVRSDTDDYKVYKLQSLLDVTKLLIAHEADLSLRDKQGNLALHWMQNYK